MNAIHGPALALLSQLFCFCLSALLHVIKHISVSIKSQISFFSSKTENQDSQDSFRSQENMSQICIAARGPYVAFHRVSFIMII